MPENKVGVIYEDVGFRKNSRLDFINLVQEELGDVGWKNGYINTGFMVFSKQHRDLFKVDLDCFWNGLGYDDVHIGYMLHKLDIDVFNLSFRFNHMSMFSEFGFNWLKSYVIHYAGTGFYRRMPRENQMRRDLKLINSYSPSYLNYVNVLPRFRLLLLGVYGFLMSFVGRNKAIK